MNQPKFPSLEGDLNTDVLIIGGGIAGLLEAGELCGGVTGNTTAKITIQRGLIYDRLMRTFGVEKARLYLKANLAALKEYRVLCRSIDGALTVILRSRTPMSIP